MKRYLLCFLIGIILVGCGKDNDDLLSSLLGGVWSHESHMCGFSPRTPLENETYTWSFDTKQKLLTVESSYDGDFFCIPPPGKYNIVVEGSKISIESISYDFSVTSEKLIVSDNPAADGPQFIFVK